MEKKETLPRRTATLETLAELYDIRLNSLRKWAARRTFPGIIQRPGARRIYVDVERFDAWFRAGATEEGRE